MKLLNGLKKTISRNNQGKTQEAGNQSSRDYYRELGAEAIAYANLNSTSYCEHKARYLRIDPIGDGMFNLVCKDCGSVILARATREDVESIIRNRMLKHSVKSNSKW